MPDLAAVQHARATFTEALTWSVMKWLTEKKKVRKIADAANLALDNAEKELRSYWDPHIETAYTMLQNHSNGSAKVSAESQRAATAIKHAHDKAMELRNDAEALFAKAEERMSISMAREACQKALDGWHFHEEAVRLSIQAATGSAAKKR